MKKKCGFYESLEKKFCHWLSENQAKKKSAQKKSPKKVILKYCKGFQYDSFALSFPNILERFHKEKKNKTFSYVYWI